MTKSLVAAALVLALMGCAKPAATVTSGVDLTYIDNAIKPGDDFDAYLAQLRECPLDPYEYGVFSAHQMGTCRMGSDPATSVANPEGELHDTPGVWIGDASAVERPTTPAPITRMGCSERGRVINHLPDGRLVMYVFRGAGSRGCGRAYVVCLTFSSP